jgi:hypothetical protein
MPTPRHIDALEHFNARALERFSKLERFNKAEHLVASVAFGMFVTAEKDWINTLDHEPKDPDYKKHHDIVMSTSYTDLQLEAARQSIDSYVSQIVQSLESQFLASALEQNRKAASKGHSAFRWRGVVEAIVGAFVWTIILIVIPIIAGQHGVDLFEYYQRAAGLHHQ